ncbi:MAG: glycosyltransferase [Candidatus Rokuibacteriota bacterium]
MNSSGKTPAERDAPTRVLFLLATLDGGGAERTALTLVPHLQARGLDARIGLLARHGALDGEIDPSRVVLARVAPGWMSYAPSPGPGRLLAGLSLVPLQQLDLIRQFRPHVVVSCTAAMNLAALLSTRAYGRRRVAWILREGNNTRATLEDDTPGRLGRAARWWATRVVYRAPDRVLTISNGVADGLARDFGVPRERVWVLHNPVEVSRISRLAQEVDGMRFPPRFIVACGRLHRQKGFDLLLRAFASLRDADLALAILGEGPERGHLQALARELGIDAQLVMPGFVRNPWAWIAHASAFVLSSRWEGFGSILVEAMACGTPVVAADCQYGPREILHDGEAGLLARVDDTDSLATAIHRVLVDPALRTRLAARGRLRATDFDAPSIADRYAELVQEAATLVRRTSRRTGAP